MNRDISELTFVFNQGILSPPEGTYFGKPDKAVAVEENEPIQSLEFSTYKRVEPNTFTYSGHNARFNGHFYPFSMQINGGRTLHIMPKQQKLFSTEKVELEQNEHLVSVFVETDAYYPVKIHFLIFNEAH